MILLFLLFLLSACDSSLSSNTTSFNGVAMTIPYRVIVGSSLDPQSKQEVESIISGTFDKIDRIYNKWNPKSELSKLNQAKAQTKILLSKELYAFLLNTETFVHLSYGRFDPTIEPLQQLWKGKLAKNTLPVHAEIDHTSKICGWDQIHLESGYAWKNHDLTSIDLGGIAKGYAIDLITERLVENGYDSVFVEWGGEIRTHGIHPDNRPWKVMVTKWGIPGDSDQVIELDHCAIASSGDYLQNWTVDRITYTHIIDPIEKTPLLMRNDTICSVTVVAKDCMLADTLATTAMLFRYPEKADLWLKEVKETFPEIQYWIFTRSR